MQINEPLDRQPRMWHQPMRGRLWLDHPGRQQRQGPIGLPDDKMVGAPMSFDTDHNYNLAGARVE